MFDLIEWLKPCFAPLIPHDVGVDSTYDIAFERIKQEIEKLSGCDYGVIIDNSHALLSTTTKDLRVAGYLCLGLTYTHKTAGLVAGLSLYSHLLQQFGEQLYPKSANGKATTIAWLNNPKLTAFLNDATMDHAIHSEISITINTLNSAIKHLSESYQTFNILNQWLLTKPKTLPSQNKAKQEKQATETESIIQTPKDASQLQEQLILFWQKENHWPLACELARTHRWSVLSIPPHKKGKTNIPPPRKEARIQLEKSASHETPEKCLALCESLFMGPSGAFYLDLQYHAHQAAINLPNESLASDLQQRTFLLCQKHPQLLTLRFTDNTPFASTKVKDWLHQDNASQTAPKKTSASALLNQAPNTHLNDTLSFLDTYPAQSALEKLFILQAKGRACIQDKHYKLGYIFYKTLFTESYDKQLMIWQPEEALPIWQEIATFLSEFTNKLPSQDTLALLEKVKTAMCLTNSQGAMAVSHL